MSNMTVGELREALSGLPDDTEISFEGGLTFNRLKRWGDNEFVVLWAELIADLSPAFRREHPDIKVAFVKAPDMTGPTEMVYVPRL